jgi:hypothetical protein
VGPAQPAVLTNTHHFHQSAEAAEREHALTQQVKGLTVDITAARADQAETEATRLAQALAAEQTGHGQSRQQLDDLRAELAHLRTDAAAAAELTTAQAQLEQTRTDLHGRPGGGLHRYHRRRNPAHPRPPAAAGSGTGDHQPARPRPRRPGRRRHSPGQGHLRSHLGPARRR